MKVQVIKKGGMVKRGARAIQRGVSQVGAKLGLNTRAHTRVETNKLANAFEKSGMQYPEARKQARALANRPRATIGNTVLGVGVLGVGGKAVHDLGKTAGQEEAINSWEEAGRRVK